METIVKFDESKLQIHIEYSNKIELAHYINSLNSVNSEYSNYISKANTHLQPNDIKLFVNEIRSGSIITDLIAYSPTMLAFAEHANTLLDFTKHIANTINLLKNNPTHEIIKEEKINTTSLNNMQGLVEPILTDRNGNISFEGVNFGDNCIVNVTINSSDANDIYNKAQSVKDFRPTPDTNIKEQVLLVFTQTNSSTKNTNNDKGVIESISKNTIKIRFANDSLKKEMFFKQHPYGVAFIVDVEIQTINDKPFIYKVLKLHECINIDE
ncbi:hypothetical protein B9T33_10365 [Acinetobacter sp. ANC 5054]|uniref:hypothetical protein n=1 Tax=Acinetobacter sp. ANC 5054 TaxID=1977877 RepID=UPI000A3408DF|nr:hypothetical protein [Acinetobacter sp. ANC 5054]OTG79917.1 hypothetical protein B9T33_10365 [Acinetobacter sp. ANC 5054]